MIEKRQFDRELTVGVTTLAQRADGTVSEGVVRDVSAGGIQISGDAAGFAVGETVDMVVVVNGQSVRYTCEVRHVDEPGHLYGVVFRSGPQAVQAVEKIKRCMRCHRDFPTDCNYCSYCGQKLVACSC